MDLRDRYERTEKRDEPLAYRIRPKTLDDIVGQEEILGKDKLLYRAVKSDRLSSIILYGPPGTGKTTLAMVISNQTEAEFRQINATTSGKEEMKEVIQDAKDNKGMFGKKTILFIDEIHRFNKAQQDYLLPYVESGLIVLIGATTENPYFEVNRALLSRSQVFELKPLKEEDIKKILIRAVNDEEDGLGNLPLKVEDDALDFLSEVSGGDARAALNALEIGALTTEKEDGVIHITLDVAQECIQKKAVSYDKNGDEHYNTISAFIKSMRGSDPDAVSYYLAKMLAAGEDIKFIARRIMICASEDVGNADPMALVVAVNASLAVERVGMPEARIILSQAALYVANAPKSNSAIKAIDSALETANSGKAYDIPSYLKDAHYQSAAKLNNGTGYKYPHDYPEHWVKQQYLPDELKDETFYVPSAMGKEKDISDVLYRHKT